VVVVEVKRGPPTTTLNALETKLNFWGQIEPVRSFSSFVPSPPSHPYLEQHKLVLAHLDLGPGVLGVEHAVALAERLGAALGRRGDDALRRLDLRGRGEQDAAGGRGLGLVDLDEDAVSQGRDGLVL